MKIEAFNKKDIAPFLQLAAEENWLAEPWEFEFLLEQFPKGCFTATDEDKTAIGFVTSIRHNKSGWIGNLIVTPSHRGKGIGERLFKESMKALFDDGAETIWLTASKSGMPLYQKLGFTNIDTIIRWTGTGRGHFNKNEYENIVEEVKNDDSHKHIDSLAWGDDRQALLEKTINRGRLIQRKSGFVVVQQCQEVRQLGPFSATGYSTAENLLKSALNTIQTDTIVYLDTPASNRTALKLFNRNKIFISGSNELMYCGIKPLYKPEYIYGMATMGSCG